MCQDILLKIVDSVRMRRSTEPLLCSHMSDICQCCLTVGIWDKFVDEALLSFVSNHVPYGNVVESTICVYYIFDPSVLQYFHRIH